MEAENGIEEKASPEGQEARDKQIVKAVRKNSAKELKEAFVQFIYGLPDQEEQQRQYMHRVMLKTEIMLQASYGMTEDIKEKFQQFYNNLKSLNAARTVDVCYKILCDVIEERQRVSQQDETRLFEGYLAEAAAYIDEHLQDEELSVVSVAAHVYLNPVYFGRVFKNTFQMTFKQYLLQKRMEKAKELLEWAGAASGTSARRWASTIRPIFRICLSSILENCPVNIRRNINSNEMETMDTERIRDTEKVSEIYDHPVGGRTVSLLSGGRAVRQEPPDQVSY